MMGLSNVIDKISADIKEDLKKELFKKIKETLKLSPLNVKYDEDITKFVHNFVENYP